MTPRFAHEREVRGAVVRAYLLKSRLVFVRGSVEGSDYVFEEAAIAGSAADDEHLAVDLCAFYGAERDAVVVKVRRPEGAEGAGTFNLVDCGIGLVGPTRRMSGRWPRSERQWRELYLHFVSQALLAAARRKLPKKKSRSEKRAKLRGRRARESEK